MGGENKKFPLTLVVSIVALAVQVFWIYLQVHHWKDPNADYPAIIVNVAISVALWSGLVYLVIRNIDTWRHLKERQLERAVVTAMWAEWAALADTYERLDYDNRNNSSTRFPFNNSSWPGFGEPWTYIHAQLYRLSYRADHMRVHAGELIPAFGWTDCGIPRTDAGVVMVDFIREAREFQAYLDRKMKSLS